MSTDTPRPKRRALLIAAAATVLVGGAIFLVAARPFARAPETVAVERRDLKETVEISGLVEAERHVVLKPEAQGLVAALAAAENARVAAGATLLRLKPDQARLQLEQARANADASVAQATTALETARRALAKAEQTQATSVAGLRNQLAKAESAAAFLEGELARQRGLAEDGAVTRQALDSQAQQLSQARLDARIARENLTRALAQADLTQARNAVAQAETALANARAQGKSAVALASDALARTQVIAPFAGTVTEWSVDPGDMVSPGTPLGTFQDLDALRLKLPVDELDLPKMRLGGPVAITFDAYPDDAFSGRIAAISRASVETSANVRVFPVYVTFANPDHRVKPGMSGDARVIVQERKGVLAVPLGAVKREAGHLVVSRVAGRGKPETITIKPGISTLEYLEVRDGLAAGDRLVPAGTGK